MELKNENKDSNQEKNNDLTDLVRALKSLKNKPESQTEVANQLFTHPTLQEYIKNNCNVINEIGEALAKNPESQKKLVSYILENIKERYLGMFPMKSKNLICLLFSLRHQMVLQTILMTPILEDEILYDHFMDHEAVNNIIIYLKEVKFQHSSITLLISKDHPFYVKTSYHLIRLIEGLIKNQELLHRVLNLTLDQVIKTGHDLSDILGSMKEEEQSSLICYLLNYPEKLLRLISTNADLSELLFKLGKQNNTASQNQLIEYLIFNHPENFHIFFKDSENLRQAVIALAKNSDLPSKLIQFTAHTLGIYIEEDHLYEALTAFQNNVEGKNNILNTACFELNSYISIQEWQNSIIPSEMRQSTSSNTLEVVHSLVNQKYDHVEEWISAVEHLMVCHYGENKIGRESLIQLFNLCTSELFFPRITGKQAVIEILSALLNPNIINQGHRNLCGVAVTLQYFTTDPNKFITLMTNLARKGETTDPFFIKANANSCNYEEGFILAVLSAIRNTTNFFGYSFFAPSSQKPDPFEDFWGVTLPKEICKWIETFNRGSYFDNTENIPSEIIEECLRICTEDGSQDYPKALRYLLGRGGFYSKFHHYEKDPQRELHVLMEGIQDNNFCIMAVSSRLHQAWESMFTSKEMLNRFPNKTLLTGQKSHYVWARDVKLFREENGDVLGVELLISTYGKLYDLKLPLDVFNDNMHGVLIVRPSLEFREENRMNAPERTQGASM